MRICDCDFCVERDLVYISDPKGQIKMFSTLALNEKHQGSQQASFFSCPRCHTILAVGYKFSGKFKGALSANLLVDSDLLAVPEVVSPKQLSAQEKIERWNLFWMPLFITQD